MKGYCRLVLKCEFFEVKFSEGDRDVINVCSNVLSSVEGLKIVLFFIVVDVGSVFVL